VHIRHAVRLLGETLVTLGVVLLLFVGYELFWTNVSSEAHASTVVGSLRQDWATHPSGSLSGRTASGAPMQLPDGAFGLMFIPRLGKSWVQPIIQSASTQISLGELSDGVVHYRQTAMPGQVGNFAVAGHRMTHGQPFINLNTLRPGDDVIVETSAAVYTYVVDNDPNAPASIVQPTALWVLDPVPGHPQTTPTQALVTLITCNPRWSSTHRMIVWGHLVSTQLK
jgi:sortase A